MTLALDLGSKTGFAMPGVSGVMEFRPGRFEGGGMRFLRFRRWLTEMLDQHGVTEVVFEEVRAHKGTDAAQIYGGFVAQLSELCESRGLPYAGVPVGEIKRHLTGKGNANKEAMVAAVRGLGYSPKDDNEADAIALLRCHQAKR